LTGKLLILHWQISDLNNISEIWYTYCLQASGAR